MPQTQNKERADYFVLRNLFNYLQVPVEVDRTIMKIKYPSFTCSGRKYIFDSQGQLFKILMEDGTLVTDSE